MFQGTTQEFADLIQTEYLTASGLIRYLLEKNLIQKTGTRPAKTGKGKPSSIFTIPESIHLEFKKAA